MLLLLLAAATAERPNHIFIKVPKCASSTSGGVARRLAMYWNLSHVFDGAMYLRDPAYDDDLEPKVYANHVPRHSLEGHLDFRHLRLPIFPMWTMVRKPADRWLSEYFHFVVANSNGRIIPSENSILHFLNDTRRPENFMLEYIRARSCSPTDIDCNIAAYDFIGAVEVFDFSMVQLAKVMDVPLSAVLYVPSKVSAQREKFAPEAVNTGMAGQSPAVQAFLASPEWQSRNSLDLQLWSKVTHQVKNNMDDDLYRQLDKYSVMLRQAKLLCSDPHFSDCYWKDNGCGFRCMDTIFYSKSSDYAPEVTLQQ